MERTAVTSSNIKSIGFELVGPIKSRDIGTVEVEFMNGAIWQYADVPASVALDVIGARSVGAAFAAQIKGKYDGTMVQPARVKTPSAVTVDQVCEHGTAMDVHCCNCHSGFIFDRGHQCPDVGRS